MTEEYRFGSTVSVSSAQAEALVSELSDALHPDVKPVALEVLIRALESQFEESPGAALKTDLGKIIDREVSRRGADNS